MLKTELFVFIRSHPQFSANVFEELERIEKYVEIVSLDSEKPIENEVGWYVVHSGKGTMAEKSFAAGSLFYCAADEKISILEPGIAFFFSRAAIDRFMRKEPEIAIPLAETLQKIRYPEQAGETS